MALTPPPAPLQPSLNDPSTYNNRALAQFVHTGVTIPNWIAGLEANDYFHVLGKVSMVNGVPTGAIMEQGENANGMFYRFANRLQICRAYISYTGATTTESALYRSATTTWVFPAAFASQPALGGSASGITRWLTFGFVGNFQSDFRVYSSTPNSANAVARLYAIGAW